MSKAQASVILIDLQEVDPELPTREDSEEAPAVSAPARLLRANARFLRTWGILLLGLAVLGAGGWWVSNSPLFELRTLHISGNSHVTPGEVARIAGLDEHTNVIWFSSRKVEHSLEENPWIKVARVSRTLPSVISVVIEERSPVAMVMPGAWLVASDGIVLGPAGPGARLPQIEMRGADLRAGSRLSVASGELAVVGSLPPNLLHLVAKASSSGGTLLLTLRNGVIVNYGDSSFLTEKSLALQAVLTWAARNGVRPISVDVRAPGSPALVPSPD